LAGIGNATIANLTTDLAKTFFTRKENKPATKGDIQALLNGSKERCLYLIFQLEMMELFPSMIQ